VRELSDKEPVELERPNRTITMGSTKSPRRIGDFALLEKRLGQTAGRALGASLMDRRDWRLVMVVAVEWSHIAYKRGDQREILRLDLKLASVNSEGTVHAPEVSTENLAFVKRFVCTQPFLLSKQGASVDGHMLEMCAALVAAARQAATRAAAAVEGAGPPAEPPGLPRDLGRAASTR
jgi:hypothetical protein